MSDLNLPDDEAGDAARGDVDDEPVLGDDVEPSAERHDAPEPMATPEILRPPD